MLRLVSSFRRFVLFYLVAAIVGGFAVLFGVIAGLSGSPALLLTMWVGEAKMVFGGLVNPRGTLFVLCGLAYVLLLPTGLAWGGRGALARKQPLAWWRILGLALICTVTLWLVFDFALAMAVRFGPYRTTVMMRLFINTHRWMLMVWSAILIIGSVPLHRAALEWALKRPRSRDATEIG